MVLMKVHRLLNKLIKNNALKSRHISLTACRYNQSDLTINSQSTIQLIGINRPTKRNSLTPETLRQLRQAIRDFENNDDFRVAVLHGEGGNFCSGFDIDEIIEKGYSPYIEALKEWQDVPLCTKPLIAAVSGYAVAEGFELALACDLRVVEDTAMAGVLGRRYGAPLLMGGGRRLADLLGASKAMDLTITGRVVTAKDLENWGLVARFVSTGTGMGQATNLALSVAKFPENGLKYDKLNLLKSRWSDAEKERTKCDDEYMDNLREAAFQEMQKNALKFKEGIGKHAKFHYITPQEISSWEVEDNIETDKYRKRTR